MLWFLPFYFIVYFGLVFVANSLRVARKTGVNPLVLPKDDSAYGLIGLYFKLLLAGMFIYTLGINLYPDYRPAAFFSPEYYSNLLVYIGWGLLVFSLVWSLWAQKDMRDSWRIGIDEQHTTDLITTGLFSVSRNPIFLGMKISLLGLFFVSPDAATLLFLVLGSVLMQIQVRLEEVFLLNKHGKPYSDYKMKVRRF